MGYIAERSHVLEAGFIVLSALAFLGYTGVRDGNMPIFSASLTGLITETSAHTDATPTAAELADLNSFSEYSFGYGGQPRPPFPDVSLVQENSLMPPSPADTHYQEELERRASMTTEYVVTEGDSLSRIAFDFGVSVDAILRLNSDLDDPHSLSLGMVLEIPPVEGIIHTVAQEDSIDSLADGYRADADAIASFNGLTKESVLISGTRLIIPGGTVPEAETEKETTEHRNFSYLPSSDDYFQKPTEGILTQNIHGRNAVDIANRCGTPIYAAAGGIVSTANGTGAWNGGYGQYVVIGHANGTETLYAHAQKVFVGGGESISRGQLIAEIGNTGQVYGIGDKCHLHFEVHGAQNPLARY